MARSKGQSSHSYDKKSFYFHDVHFFYGAKIVQIEDNTKIKMKFLIFLLLRCRLFCQKIQQNAIITKYFAKSFILCEKSRNFARTK